jgi:predicted alpha/beta superfamily hydrolase
VVATEAMRSSRALIVALALSCSACAQPAARATAPAPPSAPAPASPTTGSPVASADAAQAPVLPHQTFTLESKALGETRRINVYAPPPYADAGDARFPILYMPDGGVAEDFPHVIATADAAIRAGEMRPVIVVGIENTERRRDMTGPTEVASDKTIAPRVGGSARFRAFLRDELMPAMSTRVRGDGRTAIIGESLAGLFIVETFFIAPEMFDTFIAISPSLWWNDRALVRGAGAWRKAHPRSTKTLYLTVAGDDDRDDAIAALASTLRADPPEGLTWFYEPMLEERHSTIYRASESRVLRKVFPPVAVSAEGSARGGR